MSISPARIVPMGARVLSRLLPPAQMSAIIFVPHTRPDEDNGTPSAFRSKPAVVVAVGPGYAQDDGSVVPLTLRPGDEILLPTYPGVAVPEYGIDDETGEVSEIRDSRLSGLMMTEYDQIVCVREK